MKRTPRDYYGDKIRDEIFGSDARGKRSPAWIANRLGISEGTVRNWRRDPGKMPAWQYLRIKTVIEE